MFLNSRPDHEGASRKQDFHIQFEEVHTFQKVSGTDGSLASYQKIGDSRL
jgi:hypothetical protein